MANANFKRDIEEKWRNEASNTDDWGWKKHKAQHVQFKNEIKNFNQLNKATEA